MALDDRSHVFHTAVANFHSVFVENFVGLMLSWECFALSLINNDSCKSSNVVYLITCQKCSLQSVGEGEYQSE